MDCALLTSRSICDQRSTIRPTAASTSSRPATSHCSAIAVPPRASISATTAWHFERVRPSTTVFAPSAATARATPRPTPWPAPVTMATWPANLPSDPLTDRLSAPRSRFGPGKGRGGEVGLLDLLYAADQIGRRSLQGDAPMIEHVSPVGYLEGVADVLLDQKDPCASIGRLAHRDE